MICWKNHFLSLKIYFRIILFCIFEIRITNIISEWLWKTSFGYWRMWKRFLICFLHVWLWRWWCNFIGWFDWGDISKFDFFDIWWWINSAAFSFSFSIDGALSIHSIEWICGDPLCWNRSFCQFIKGLRFKIFCC